MTPDEFTIQEAYVDVGDGHNLYVQDWGNRAAQTPIIFIHGGPGDSVKDRYRQRFNPYVHRIIFFDQRGCGRSTPYGSLDNNTTTNLVDDIEKIAEYLKLKNIALTGGSWGSCLALAYGLRYPARVKTMVIQGIFTGSKAEIKFLDEGRFRTFFPDAWENYLNKTPKSHHTDPSAYHFSRILGSDASAARESAYIYSTLEGSLMSLDDRYAPEDPQEFDPVGTKIEVYYLANGCFMRDRYILDNAHKLNMPLWLVQGRYDFVCPPSTAYELHQKTSNSTLLWTMAGHGNDRSNYDVMRTIFAHWT